jgi:putative FmdB family regulatory protein
LPLYPYRCTQCGYKFEKIQRFNAKPEKVCPTCGGALERTLTAPGLQFKGAGWYVTDYAAKSSSSGEAAPAEAASAEKKPATDTKTQSASDSGSSSTTPAASAPAAKPGTPSSTKS